MLGNRMSATIMGNISEKGVYSGYVYNQSRRLNAFIISAAPPKSDTVYGTVIAITDEDTPKQRLIISASNDELCEPQIMELLSDLKTNKIDKINCLYEKSCGAVICTQIDDQLKVLLVKNHNGKYWSFPKGHIEHGETEQDTAIREIKEETGLDVTLLDGFRETSEYCPYGRVKKRVVFFIAISQSHNVHIQQNEIDCFTWTTFDEATTMCCFDNDLRVLQKARPFVDNYIKNNS
ncbi:MAG: bis(5'-nucleosyl)-tetraphosphatase [Acutalibacteraceae bacterium]